MKKKRVKPPKKSLTKQVIYTFDIPENAVFDVPSVEIIGKSSVIIEGHYGLLDYSGEQIRIAAKNMNITVTGMDLVIKVMNKREIELSGNICEVKYE